MKKFYFYWKIYQKTETGKKWKFVISIYFVFELLSVELNYMKPKEDQLHIAYKN